MSFLRRLVIGDTDLLDAIKETPIKDLRLTQPDELFAKMSLYMFYEKTLHVPEYLGVVRSKNPGVIEGIVTPGDVTNYNLRQAEARKTVDFRKTQVDDFMNKKYESVDENDTIKEVRAKFLEHNLRKILITDESKKNAKFITRESFALQIRELAGV